ncbi:MAG TPA: MFS transporter [Chloroflexi bacterium]|nr:MFS transporter [Chloroflexota bacterium]
MNRDTRLITLALLLWGFGEGLFLYIQPLYMEQLGADPIQIGGLLSATSLVSALTFLPAGILSDRLPRKWVMWGGWGLGLVGVLLVALARTWQGLIPALLLYSFSAYCMPVINAYLAHSVGGINLERTFTTVSAGYAAGSLISPAVGGWLAGETTMRTVYLVSAAFFALSSLVVAWVSPQPVIPQVGRERPWQSLLNRRVLSFAALTGLTFTAMYVSFPLVPNFLADVRGWDVAWIGMLGSFQSLGTIFLNLLLGHLAAGNRRRGLMVGQGLVWAAALLLLRTHTFPPLALAYLLRGAYMGCRSLAGARATALGSEAERGVMLGAAESIIAIAQVIAPSVAGWLYVSNPTYPLLATLTLIPLTLLLTVLPISRWAGEKAGS